MIFHAGDKGQINGLENIGFVDDVLVEYAKFQIPLMFGAPAYCDTAACRDKSFSELKKGYDKLLLQLQDAGLSKKVSKE